MKMLIKAMLVLVMVLGVFLGGGLSQPANAASGIVGAGMVQQAPVLAAAGLRNEADDKRLEAGGKLDLNNANVRAFLNYPGMYPNIAKKIVAGAPYDNVNDVLKLSSLSERQREVLQKYLDQFTVTAPSDALVEGFDRINNGIYR